MAKILSKDQILKADDLPTEVVKVPEWGGHVIVRTLTAAQKDDFEISVLKSGGKEDDRKIRLKNFRARLGALVIIDVKGERLFSDAEAVQLGMKSCSVMDRIYEVASKLNAIGDSDVEELVKNSEKIQGDDLSSD